MPRKLKIIPDEHFDTICGLHEAQGLGARRIDKAMGGIYGHPFVSVILKECQDPLARQRRTGTLGGPKTESLTQILTPLSLDNSVNVHQALIRPHESEKSGTYAPESWTLPTRFEPLMILEDSPGLQIGDIGLTHADFGANSVIDNGTTNPWTSQAEWEFEPFMAFLQSSEIDPSLYLRAILESKKRRLKRSYVDRVLHGTGAQTTDLENTNIQVTPTQRDLQIQELVRRAEALLNSNNQESTPPVTHVEGSPKATTQPPQEATIEDTDAEKRAHGEPKHVEGLELGRQSTLEIQPTVESYRKSGTLAEHDLADNTRNKQRPADDNRNTPDSSVEEIPNNVHEAEPAGLIESQPIAGFVPAKPKDNSSPPQPPTHSEEHLPITPPSAVIAKIKTDMSPTQSVEVVSTPILPSPAKVIPQPPPSNPIQSPPTEVPTTPNTDHVQGNRSDATPSQSVCPIGCSILVRAESNQNDKLDTVDKIILVGAGLSAVAVIAAPHLRNWYVKWKQSKIQNHYSTVRYGAVAFIPATQTFRPSPQLYGKVTGVAFY